MLKLFYIVLCFVTFGVKAQIISTPLAGKHIQNAPWIQFINNFQTDDTVYFGINPTQFPDLINKTVNVYVVKHRIPDSYKSNQELDDIRGIAQQVTISGVRIKENIFVLEQSWFFAYQVSGSALGVGYDLIIDIDNNGLLSSGDIIDGWNKNIAGFYKVHNTANPGNYKSAVQNYTNNDVWLNKRIFYPQNIASLGKLPLVIVSHGVGHDYFMYDYIGEHLASYGYIVVVHANDVKSAKTNSAALTTLKNTDHFIGEQNSLLNGIFKGHIDTSKIAFIGHSVGGEGIVRAYTEIQNNEYAPDNFALEDIKLLCPIAPTASLTSQYVDPGFANFHLFAGGADGDIALFPCAESNSMQSFAIFERSKGNRQLTYIHGAKHNDFNSSDDYSESWLPEAPGLIGKANTFAVVKSYLLPLMELYLNNNVAGLEYFTRTYDDFHPAGIPDSVKIAKEYKQKQGSNKLVIDDFQANINLDKSSSGSLVTYTADHIFEIEMRDNDWSLDWDGTQQSNGFTRSKAGDDPRCMIMDWDSDKDGFYRIEIPASSDIMQYEYLSFRACQGTRHPNTNLLNRDMAFRVSLIDNKGNSSSVSTANYGLINRPYNRYGGWANEFETVIIRLNDFVVANPAFNLNTLEAVRFDFGKSFGCETGRLAIDDIELIGDREIFDVVLSANMVKKQSDVTIYPNPAIEDLTIKGLELSDHIYLVNSLGQFVKNIPSRGNETHYYTGDLKPGFYFLYIFSGEKHQIKSVIKLLIQ